MNAAGALRLTSGVLIYQAYCMWHVINPLNATGANMHQRHMLTENCGIERVKRPNVEARY